MYFIFLVLGTLATVLLYPNNYNTPDMTYNVVYARDWLPMYWHGFLTNVICNAFTIVFFHPIGAPLGQSLLGITIFYYFICKTLGFIQVKYKKLIFICFLMFLCLVPETQQILFFYGRNYFYPLLTLLLFSILIIDYHYMNELNINKIICLAFLMGIILTWRGEGILFLLGFVCFLPFVYDIKGNKANAKKITIFMILLGTFYLLMMLPDKYGFAKYQGKDYQIINTPGAISAILNSKNRNVSYRGADVDIKNLDIIAPAEYFMTYGDYTTGKINWENGRLSRQCGLSDEEARIYMESANSLFLHNLHIYLPYQINNCFASLEFPYRIKSEPNISKWDNDDNLTIANKQFKDDVMSNYSIGSNWLNACKPHNLIIDKVTWLASGVFNLHRKITEKIGIFIKHIVLLLSLLLICVSFIKKRYLYFLMFGFNICMFLVIMIVAPSIRANYYYGTFNLLYFLIFYYICFYNKRISYEK